jgi:photosystem II stability/assembly factor-like uncharacterized protein
MGVKELHFSWLAGLAAIALLTACNLSGRAPTAFPLTTATFPNASPATVTFGNAQATEARPSPSQTVIAPSQTSPAAPPTSAAPTTVPPTPALGPAMQHLAAGQKIAITYIKMVDVNQGWGIGGLSQVGDHVFRTQDGGKSWRDVTPPQPAPDAGQQLQALGAFRSASSAWVIFSLQEPVPASQTSRVWVTTDGGVSWKSSALDISAFQETFTPSDMVFVDDQHGWFLAHVGVGMNHDYIAVVATADGGQSWRVLLDPYQDGGIQSCPKHAMLYADTRTGWLTPDCMGVGAPPSLFKTSDGGATWQPIGMPAPASGYFDDNSCGMHASFLFSVTSAVFSMQCLDNGTFKIEHDFLYSTADGGSNWKAYALPSDFTVLDPPSGGLFFINVTSGLVLGRRIYRTGDGGKTWSLAKTVNWDGQFSFLDLNTGWAVARNAGQVALVRTVNGGGTWQELKPSVAP